MDTAIAPLVAVHLAVLVEVSPSSSSAGMVTAVLVYDGCGYRHLHPLEPTLPAERLALGDPGPGQLQLPIGEMGARPTSSGLGWRTFVLPSVPVELRGLPPWSLAAAFADRLACEAEQADAS